MLQQTQTSRVVELLPPFLERYPDPAKLALASNAEVIRSWRGLGYNNRAIRLRDAARHIVEKHRGVVPRNEVDLLDLPGVGGYTAGAVRCFAYGEIIPLLEVNIVRLLSRIFHACYDSAWVLPEKSVGPLARRLLPDRDVDHWNQALMDLGATVCKARVPACAYCPVQKECLSAHRLADREYYSRDAERRASERRIAGRPIRIWRGWIVEQLRSEGSGVRIAELHDRALDLDAGRSSGISYGSMIDILERLMADGIVARAGIGEPGDQLSLPDIVELAT